MQLAGVLKAIISSETCPKIDGKGRVPAVEIMLNTATIKDCIADKDKTAMIADYIEQGRSVYGSQSFDQSLLDLYNSKLIAFDEAKRWARRPDDFELKVKGISSTSESWVDMYNKILNYAYSLLSKKDYTEKELLDK